jgi:hypothetical protein
VPTAARGGRDDVEEHAVDGKSLAHLDGLLLQEVHIRGIETQPPVEPGIEGLRPRNPAVFVHSYPLGVLLDGEQVPLHGDVDRYPDVSGVAGLDLLLEQVAGQVRVPTLRESRGIVIDHAVVTAREAGDRVDMSGLERVGELIGIEPAADAGDQLAGMEVEVDLSVAQVDHGILRG